MEYSLNSSRLVQFGIYEVDLHAGELRKAGVKLKLSGQPFQVLTVLLEQPGKLVSREELQKRLWPDTFVDVDHNLNTAINKIRDALSDSAENPRFVETLPKRGYRFIAPLNGVQAASLALPSRPDTEDAVRGNGSGEIEPFFSSGESTLRRHGLLYFGVAGAVLLCLALSGYLWTHYSQPSLTISRYVQLTGDSKGKTSSYADEVPSPLLSDGSRLFFMEGPLGNKKLAQVSTGGGEVTGFSASLRIRRAADISPDRRELLVLSSEEPIQMEVPLMVVPLPGGSPHRIGDVLAHDASYSPDGLSIAYASGNELFHIKSDGSGGRKLATLPGSAWWPRWSPDGNKLRFTVLESGSQSKLWEVGTDGTALQRVLPEHVDPIFQCCGTWTPDGKYFVFASSFYQDNQFWAIRENSGRLHNAYKPARLTTGPMSVTAPLSSANGDKLFGIAVQQRGQLVRYDRKSGQFVPFLAGISAEGLDFSKDGLWTTYVTWPEGTLWRSKIDGSERLQLTLRPIRAFLPRWSPDGKQIAFLGQQGEGKPLKIYLVSAKGGSSVQAVPGERSEGEPSWSPDGNLIAFAPLFWLEKDNQTSIRILDLRTGQVTTLPGSEGHYSPRWSPDGRQLAAMTADSATKLVVFDLASHKRVELCNHAAYPNWSHDGRFIYFNDPYSEALALYRVQANDGKVERITTLDPSVLHWAIVGKWAGLAPDDSPLVLRDTSIEEIYDLELGEH